MSKKLTSAEGLSRIVQVYQQRDKRARELKSQGKKIVGYFCCYPPTEIMTAADVVPFRITGNVREPITTADAYVERNTCPFLRSCFDIAFKQQYDFLDGIVVPHACDHLERTYPLWRFYFTFPYCHFINVPHTLRPASNAFFKAELDIFKKSLEQFTGKEIPHSVLREAIELHNENRALLRGIYALRKLDPPLLSGTEIMQILLAVLSLPVTEGNGLLKKVEKEARQRQAIPAHRSARVLLYGGPLDDIAFVQLVEECGATVVMDDTCFGTRHFWHDVANTPDPLEGLARRYLEKIYCPRTFREGKAGSRLGYLLDFAREFKANSAIVYTIRYCDTYGFDLPDVRDTLRQAGIPALTLIDDYNMNSIAALRTRVQAFIEMVT